jgi:general secretion pathway protein E
MNVDAAVPPTIYRAESEAEPFAGRTGIYELVTIDSEMRTMIHDGVSEHELERYARTRGPSIRDDGMRRVLAGSTTLEEVLRVTRSD